MNAAGLGALPPIFDRPVGAVVSGLPLLSIPHGDVKAIIRGAFTHVRPEGAFYQFTYLPRCPVPSEIADELALDCRRISAAWVNLPPAFIFRIKRTR
jgi:phospholipid N-methyltransferase